MRFRAFIAADIEPSNSLRQILNDLRDSRADLKLVRPELLHFTLKFLGDIEESSVDEIETRMESACEGVGPLTVRLRGMGAFPSMANIRVVWIGIEDGKSLSTIAQRLDSSLEELGFARDSKGFKPHLTIARSRSGRGLGDVTALMKESLTSEYGTYRISCIRLKKSVLSPQGPTYSTIREVALRGPPEDEPSSALR
jgi:2'-5' RNA ligase